MGKPILVGAVVYDPKVVLIWEIIGAYFQARGCPMDTVFYNNYELQVASHLQGHFDIAWNSPLAWLDTVRHTDGRCRGLAMRDTDQDRVTHLVVRADSPVHTLDELRGRRLGCGAWDSPQATLIPQGLLAGHGLRAGRDYEALCFDVLAGKHGDHIGGEADAVAALRDRDVDAAALLDLNWQAWTADGSLDPAAFRVLASTPVFDHCIFTALEGFDRTREQAWLDVLFSMDYADPDHRRMMDMEGLKEWRPGRVEGFRALDEAARRLRFFERRDAGEFAARA